MLNAGTMIGPYEIQLALGTGGMGEVYKARDTRLDRVVALKVLPQALAADPHFRERFAREARTISQFSHPNICTIYDVGEAPSPESEVPGSAVVRFIVMEYLVGESLEARLERGALKLDEALRIAAEMSSALDQAHRAGIVHRDLKPANVMLTPSGAKLLDFGLAKKAAAAVTGPGGSILPATGSRALTAQGTIVGTFQYMAPEQLEGAEADARADIFAFGAILYEMVTGRKAFEGKSQVSLISAILKDEPPPIGTLIPVAPKALDRIIRACLSKDPDARLRSTHDLFLQLQWVADAEPHVDARPKAPAPPIRHRRRTGLPWRLAGILGLAVLGSGVWILRRPREAPPAADAIQFTIQAAENSVFQGTVPTFAISPDGRHVVFVALPSGAAPRLFLRSLGTLTVKPLPGTELATYPFWSPDSKSVAFFTPGKLKRVPIGGGSPTTIVDAPSGRGGTWNRDNVIVFAPSVNGTLERVSAAGGAPAPATRLDTARGETTHKWPSFLPDGRHFMYFAPSDGQRPSEVRVGSLDSPDVATVVAAESMATYASGHLFFWRDGGVMAQPFDGDTRQANGDPVRVAEPVGQTGGYASYSVSQTGVLVYSRGSVRPTSQLTWMDRAGKAMGTVGDPGDYFNMALSPDERRVAVTLQAGTPENRDIWLIDLARSVSSRVTFDPAYDVLPTWSPDGERIVFGSVRAASGLYQKAASGGAPEELLMKFDEGTANPLDWSRDGKFILYYNQSPKTGLDLWVLPLTGDRKPFPFLQTPFIEDHGAFAPDVRWVAYTSNESGREEVYVQPFPATGGKYRISRSGGTQPLWRGDGQELFFLAPDGTIVAASISTGTSFEAGTPQPLFASGVAFSGNRHQYAVARDGRHFLVNVPQQRSSPTPLTVVVNWQAAIQK